MTSPADLEMYSSHSEVAGLCGFPHLALHWMFCLLGLNLSQSSAVSSQNCQNCFLSCEQPGQSTVSLQSILSDSKDRTSSPPLTPLMTGWTHRSTDWSSKQQSANCCLFQSCKSQNLLNLHLRSDCKMFQISAELHCQIQRIFLVKISLAQALQHWYYNNCSSM